MDRKSFASDTKKGGGNFSDWRKDGKIIFFIHPKSEIGKRIRVQLKRVVTTNDGETEIWSVWRHFRGENDISNRFLKWLKETETIDANTVVLRIQGGDETEEYTKGELLGLKDYDWRKRLLRPRTEYLFSVANVTDSDPKGTEILAVPYSAGKKLNKVFDSQIEEYGEEEGDPWKTPYAIKLTFDKDERGSDMYGAERHQKKLTPAVENLFRAEPDDLEQYCNPDVEDDDFGSTTELLTSMCVIDCPLLSVENKREAATPAPSPAPKPKTTAPKPKTPSPAPAPKPEAPKPPARPAAPGKPAPAPVAAPSPSPAPKPPARPAAPGKPAPAPVAAPAGAAVAVKDCKPGGHYEADGETVEFVKVDTAKKVGVFKDGDGLKVTLALDAVVGSLDAAEAPEETTEAASGGDGDGTRVKDCVKGKVYYTQDGKRILFVRFNETKGKGVFSDESDERIYLDADEQVSEDVGAGNELNPVARPAGSGKPTSKAALEAPAPEPEPEGDAAGAAVEMAECPACNKPVREDAKACPHCGAEFADDGEDVNW